MNGFISLGQKVDYKNPPTSHLNWPKDVPVIAPLWTDLQPRMSNSHSRMYVYVVDRKTIIDKLFEDFEPKIVLLVTWKNIAPYPEKLTFDSEVI